MPNFSEKKALLPYCQDPLGWKHDLIFKSVITQNTFLRKIPLLSPWLSLDHRWALLSLWGEEVERASLPLLPIPSPSPHPPFPFPSPFPHFPPSSVPFPFFPFIPHSPSSSFPSSEILLSLVWQLQWRADLEMFQFYKEGVSYHTAGVCLISNRLSSFLVLGLFSGKGEGIGYKKYILQSSAEVVSKERKRSCCKKKWYSRLLLKLEPCDVWALESWEWRGGALGYIWSDFYRSTLLVITVFQLLSF